MNIVCFGASVTVQKQGYCLKLKELFGNEYTVIQKGYGSMHIFDAGISFIDDVINLKPQICLIDWFSTGYIIEDTTFLDTIVYKLYQNGCIPIFLFLDRKDIKNRENMYKFCKNYSEKNGIEYIELYDIWNKDIILRDVVHTTIDGAEIYGENIYNFLKNKIIPNMPMYFSNIICPSKNKYCFIKNLTINKIVTSEIIFTGNCEITGIYQNIGPFSGKIKYIYYDENENIKKENEVSIFDKWCHYQRKSMKNKFEVKGKVKLLILQDYFDRKAICDKEIVWNDTKNFMDIISIFYIGDIEIIKLD